MSVFDNYECEGQISMFDSFETMPEEDAVVKIGKACGIEFKKRDDFWGWEYKKKSSVIRVHYGRYVFDDCDKFISCSVDHKMGGSSCPCDSFDETIRRVKGYLKEINGE